MSTQFRPSKFTFLPDVVKNLLIINALFFLATIVLSTTYGYNLIDKLGLHFPGSQAFRPYQFITYMFMHGGFAHIFFNMFAVWMFGSVLENHWGPKKFLVYYFVTGIGAALIHYAVMYYEMSPVLSAINNYIAEPSVEKLNAFINSEDFVQNKEMAMKYQAFESEFNEAARSGQMNEALDLSRSYMREYKTDLLSLPVVVGASGALFGILLAFGMLFPNHLIYLYFAIPIKAKYFVMLYGAVELFSGITNKTSNVAHFAHLGGMLFGFILIKLWKDKNPNRFNPYE